MATGMKFSYRLHESSKIDKDAEKPMAITTAVCFHLDDESQKMSLRLKRGDEEPEEFLVEAPAMIDFARQLMGIMSSRVQPQG